MAAGFCQRPTQPWDCLRETTQTGRCFEEKEFKESERLSPTNAAAKQNIEKLQGILRSRTEGGPLRKITFVTKGDSQKRVPGKKE